jgi:hypothetical protein
VSRTVPAAAAPPRPADVPDGPVVSLAARAAAGRKAVDAGTAPQAEAPPRWTAMQAILLTAIVGAGMWAALALLFRWAVDHAHGLLGHLP